MFEEIEEREDSSEIGTLAMTFNKMIRSIKTKISDLKEENILRKLSEEELKQHKEALEFQVKERIKKLNSSLIDLKTTNEELIRTREELIQSQKLSALGTIIAGVAHEVNNPCNFSINALHILGDKTKELKSYIESLLEDGENDIQENFEKKFKELDEHYIVVDNGLERIASIVTDFKQFSRKEE